MKYQPEKDGLRQCELHQILLCVLALALVATFNGCKSKDRFVDYQVPETPAERRAVQAAAPLVLVGTVASDSAAGPATVSHWDKKLPLQLHKVAVNVEGWLRGDLHLSKIDLYYFKIAGPYSGGPPLGDWEYIEYDIYPDGRHRIFFARRDGNLLRLACDYKDSCTIRIGSGTHPDINALIAGNAPLQAKIANVLFTRGVGVSDRDFGNSLGYSAFKIDKEYAVPKLKHLIQESGNPEILREACHWLGVLRYNYTENDRRVKAICQQNKVKEPDSR